MTALFFAMAMLAHAADCRSCPLLSRMASALSEGSSVRFLDYIDKSTPGYHDIEINVDALIAQNDIATSLDVLTESGDDEKVDALVDWFLQATSKDGTERVVRRRARVHVIQVKGKGAWKVIAIDPPSILDPILSGKQ